MAEGISRRISYAEESVTGVAETSLTNVRNTGGSGLANERTNVTSGEIRSDRAIVTSRLGNNAPSSSIPIEFSFASFEDFMAAGLGHSTTWATVTYTGTSTLTIDVDATLKTFTLSTSDWLTKGVRVGDNITFSGFTNTENNIAVVVTYLDGAVLTAGDATGLVTESGSGDEGFSATTAITEIKAGTADTSFTIEEGFEDVTEYHYSAGNQVNSFNLSIQPDAVVSGSFDFQGLTYSGFSATPLDASPTDSNTNSVFDSYTGVLYVEGVTNSCVVTGLDFTVDNGLIRRYALMEQDACSIGTGRINVTGTLNAYFTDSTMADLFHNETSFKMSIVLVDLDGNKYTIGFPDVKLTADTRDISENDVTESLSFQALGTDTTDTTIYIRKQAAA